MLRLADEASAERQRASARQELLIAELNHRVRNILGVIRGLIRQSQPANDAVKDFIKVIDGRVHALARAHNQITDDHWGPAQLRTLIDAEAAAFLNQRGRIEVDGDPVLLNPQAYSTMALVMHELVTNSIKYGSLSGSAGPGLDPVAPGRGRRSLADLGGGRRPARAGADPEGFRHDHYRALGALRSRRPGGDRL